jgi:polysaccharide export outer membrane protein
MAEGIRPDAGYSVTISRDLRFGALPVANARQDVSGKVSVATIGLKSIMGSANSGDNILVHSHDIITVPRAEMVYVIGEVTKPGGFVLQERETLSVLQAVALAGGTGGTASLKNARILRTPEAGASRKEIPVDLQTILSGTGTDVQLMADDILFIPTSKSKRAAIRTLETAIQLGTGLVIWRR